MAKRDEINKKAKQKLAVQMNKIRKKILNRYDPRSARSEYFRRLKNMLKQMTFDFQTSLNRFLDPNAYLGDKATLDALQGTIQLLERKWSGLDVEQKNQEMAGKFVRSVAKHNRRNFAKFVTEGVSLGATENTKAAALSSMRSSSMLSGLIKTPSQGNQFGINILTSKNIMNVMEKSTVQNAFLIKSIQRQHLDAIANIVFQNFQAGKRSSNIIKDIQAYGVSEKRAKFIARDQTAKVNSDLSRTRMEDLGYKYFKWVDVGDGRVRSSHKQIANAKTPYGIGVYRFDDPPIIHGEKMYPGTDYQCRCVMQPVADFEVERYRKKAKGK